MKRKTVVGFLVILFAGISFVYAGEQVTFKGNSQRGNAITLKGILEKPQGKGPFPAVVMLHGCAGLEGSKKILDPWAQRLVSWGYVCLMVDSLGPRGESDICGDMRVFLIPPNVRAQDAHDAKWYLADLPFVNRNQIVLMGWSHGGWTTLYAIDETFPIQNRGNPFRSAIAFYPYCSTYLGGLDAPLLILIGELDDWCPAAMCQMRMPSGTTAHEVNLKIYPQAYHLFDVEGMDTSKEGHRLLYNSDAAKDAIEHVRNFLENNFK